jgi:hypothetical protein
MAKKNLNLKFGKGDQVIQEWLDLQQNKSWAIKCLVKAAIAHYGMQDLQAVLEGSTFGVGAPPASASPLLPQAPPNASPPQEEMRKITESFTF